MVVLEGSDIGLDVNGPSNFSLTEGWKGGVGGERGSRHVDIKDTWWIKFRTFQDRGRTLGLVYSERGGGGGVGLVKRGKGGSREREAKIFTSSHTKPSKTARKTKSQGEKKKKEEKREI